jgi:hypothetical protein
MAIESDAKISASRNRKSGGEVTAGPGHHGRRRARTGQHAWPLACSRDGAGAGEREEFGVALRRAGISRPGTTARVAAHLGPRASSFPV